MFSTRSRASRTAAVSLALAGALGLSACQDSSPSSAPPTSDQPSSSSDSKPEATSEAPESSSEAPESSSESPSSESPSSESESSSDSSGSAGDTRTAPEGTTLKFGEAANVRESSSRPDADGYRIQVDGLEKAPDSVYSGQITKANGPVYYLRYTVTNNGTSKQSQVDASSVNSFMLIPKLEPGQKGKKVIGSAPGCDAERTSLSVGQSAKGCEAYQVSGADVSDVVWQPGGKRVVTWSK